MNVDYKNITTEVTFDENCEKSDDVWTGSVINLDPDFVVPSEYQGVDRAFHRILQMKSLLENAVARGAKFKPMDLNAPDLHFRPQRRPDFTAEWGNLKRAWSLTRNGKAVLAKKIIQEASDEYYGDDPLKGLDDWVWRFCLFFSDKEFLDLMEAVLDDIKKHIKTESFGRFAAHYAKNMSAIRSRMYFSTIDEYFKHSDDFSQVKTLLSGGVPIKTSDRTATANFQDTRLSYGNFYEVLAESIDLFAFMNNIFSGREWDEFQSLSVKKFYELDKPQRFGPFADNAAMVAATAESDNQLRNASHHGNLEFDIKTQSVSYRKGKGKEGEIVSMSYAQYLEKCVRIFLQILLIFRIELLFTNNLNQKPPI